MTRPDGTTNVTDYNADDTVADQKDGKGNKIISYGYALSVNVRRGAHHRGINEP